MISGTTHAADTCSRKRRAAVMSVVRSISSGGIELQVDELGLLIARCRADPHAGIVDEHVEAPETVAVARHDLADRVLVGHVGGHVLDLVPLGAQLLGGLHERVRLARGDRPGIALLAQRLREREADPAGGSGDDCGAIGHGGEAFRTKERAARILPSLSG